MLDLATLQRIVSEDEKGRYSFSIKSGDMFRAGHKFYLSVNGVGSLKKSP